MDDEVKVSVTLPRGAVESIRRIAAANNTTLAVAITESVQMNELITQAEKAQAKIVVHERDGRLTELFRDRPQNR